MHVQNWTSWTKIEQIKDFKILYFQSNNALKLIWSKRLFPLVFVNKKINNFFIIVAWSK